MMMSLNGKKIPCYWQGESIGHQSIPHRKASDTAIWCFLWSAPEHKVEQTIKTLFIWDAIAFIMTTP